MSDSSFRSIKLLPPELQNQIAAGEVVERPASVLKELVENALDAGADEIEIQLEDGGLSLISISDNGRGIHPDELELAVTRHATSKVESFSDLLRVSSYGFRGEALPSVASVSHLHLSSVRNVTGSASPDTVPDIAPGTAPEACFIEVKHGKISAQGPTVLRCGTKVEVRDLFANVPARLKFMKTPGTELKRCQEFFFRLALTRLEVGFSLSSGQRQLFHCPKGEGLLERLGRFWPPAALEGLTEFHSHGPEIRLHGLLGRPEQAQAKADRLLFYVNKRPVNDRLLQKALREAYRGRLISREHPQAVVFVELDPEEMDVNVHPAKTEVRFRNERAVFGAVYKGVQRALDEHFSVTSFDSPFASSGAQGGSGSPHVFSPLADRERRLGGTPGHEARHPEDGSGNRNFWGELSLPPDQAPIMGKTQGMGESRYREFLAAQTEEEISVHGRHGGMGAGDTSAHTPAWQQHIPAAPASALRRPGFGEEAFGRNDFANNFAGEFASTPSIQTPEVSNPEVSSRAQVSGNPLSVQGYEYLGQIENTYLILREGSHGGMLLLDQHAAHEIILYQRLKQDGLRGQSQLLGFPLEFTLHHSERERLQEELAQLTALGFSLQEDVDAGNLQVLGLPPSLKRSEAIDFLREALSAKTEGRLEIWEMWACRAAIKAGDILTPDEALGLVSQWLGVPEREFCPHGRPVVLRFGARELEKLFKRRA